jgi:uncharacterized DUF497 family protein
VRFVWTDQNSAHVAEHGLSRADVEAVFGAPNAAVMEAERAGRWIIEGTVRGKLLRVVYALTGPDEAYPITAHRIRRRRTR